MKKIFKLMSVLVLLLSVSCFDEPVDVTANAEDVIAVDSELYNLIERVTGDDPDDIYEYTCVAFEYPFTLLTYDADLIFISAETMVNNIAFSAFLGALDPQFSISLSYPITSFFDNGSSVEINTNEELKTAIDNCIEEEFFNYCNNTLPNCIWEVNYPEEGDDNIYEDAYFVVNESGTVNLFHGDDIFTGTWTTLYIEDETHLNINLLDATDVGTDWNFDWLIVINQDGDFEISNTDNDRFILHQNCEEEESPCNDLAFQACEIEGSEGFAEFDLESYVACILFQVEIDDTESITLTFHETQIDAETNTNALISPYINVSATQTLFVRIEDITTNETTYVSIIIEAVSCN